MEACGPGAGKLNWPVTMAAMETFFILFMNTAYFKIHSQRTVPSKTAIPQFEV